MKIQNAGTVDSASVCVCECDNSTQPLTFISGLAGMFAEGCLFHLTISVRTTWPSQQQQQQQLEQLIAAYAAYT